MRWFEVPNHLYDLVDGDEDYDGDCSRTVNFRSSAGRQLTVSVFSTGQIPLVGESVDPLKLLLDVCHVFVSVRQRLLDDNTNNKPMDSSVLDLKSYVFVHAVLRPRRS
jgi:hypothetical protein